MFRLLKSLLRLNAPRDANAGSTLLDAYSSFVEARLTQKRPTVSAAFAAFFQDPLCEDIAALHVEVFLDEPAFSFRAFARDASEPPALATLNAGIAALLPIVSQREMDDFIVWEQDPQWGRQEALEQPTDHLDMKKIALPWLREIITETRQDFSGEISLSLHDFTAPEII